jgi:hypothetical protein
MRASPEALPQDVREDVRRMREALRTAARQSGLSYWRIEEALGMCGGYLNVIFAGKVELRVAHVFGILRAIGAEPRRFFLELRAAEERRGSGHDAA